MDEETTTRSAAQLAGWWWGTNRPGGAYYAGRTHVVHPEHSSTGLCGLPVDDVWEVRPAMPEQLCPECCVLAMAASYPPFPPAPAPRWPARPARTERATSADEQTAVMPALDMDTDS
ncbi:hypothetical protein [Saccharopolyspora hattusasensis]|uniref:hypothetical protein n=1 Tax=Saccharopolyspora hattusasensis TaxID=1128679 RepID=UPI003D95FF01